MHKVQGEDYVLRRLYTEKLNLCSSHNIRVIKSIRKRWAWHVEIMDFSRGNLREGHHLEDKGVDGRTILKWIFRQ
jgi:hypothetical protein